MFFRLAVRRLTVLEVFNEELRHMGHEDSARGGIANTMAPAGERHDFGVLAGLNQVIY